MASKTHVGTDRTVSPWCAQGKERGIYSAACREHFTAGVAIPVSKAGGSPRLGEIGGMEEIARAVEMLRNEFRAPAEAQTAASRSVRMAWAWDNTSAAFLCRSTKCLLAFIFIAGSRWARPVPGW